MFVRDEVGTDDIFVFPALPQKRARLKQATVPNSTSTKKTSTANHGNKGTVEEEAHTKDKDTFDDSQATNLGSSWKEQMPFKEKVLSE